MDAVTIALGLALVGVNFGWQPASDGPAGYEYIVQIEPEIADRMRRGEAVPIESHVPPEVTPIRKVRLVVGRGNVVRTPLAADSATLGKYVAGDAEDRTPSVDGKSESSAKGVQEVVRGQSPDGHFGTESASGPVNVDRYGRPIDDSASDAPQVGRMDHANDAVTEAGGALRDAFEAGFEEADQQLFRAGHEEQDGWMSSRGKDEPKLDHAGPDPPTGPPTGVVAGGESSAMGATGELLLTFPGVRPADKPLADTTSTADRDERDLVPVRPIEPRVPELQPSSSTWDVLLETDSWSQPLQESASGGAVTEEASLPEPGTESGASTSLEPTRELPAAAATTVDVPEEQVPWRPLLLTGLGLIGSLGANLFLGWSYLDARQRYQALVRRTADSLPGGARRGE